MRGFHCIEWHCLTSSHSWLLLWRCPQQLQKNKVGRVAVSIGSGLSHLRTRDDFNILCCNKAFAVILSADVEWRNPIVSVYVNVFFVLFFFKYFIHLLPHQHQGKCANSFVYFSLSFNKIAKISTLMCRRVCLKCRVCLSLGLGGGGGPFLRMYTPGEHNFLRMYLWWTLCTLYLHACQVSYRRRLRSLLYLCYVVLAHLNTEIILVVTL